MKVAVRHNKGFTLIELLVTIAIFAVIVTLAAPGFRKQVVTSTLDVQAVDFATTLLYARSEAIKRGASARVTVCKSTNFTTCTTAGTWDQGYMVFIDESGTVGVKDGTDTVLKAHNKVNDYSLSSGGTIANYVTYISSGRAQTGAAVATIQLGSFTLAANNPLPAPFNTSKRIDLADMGRVCVATILNGVPGSCN